MASKLRPLLLRQSCIALAARQALRRQALHTHALSKLNSSNFHTQSIASRALPLRSYAPKGIPLSVLRVAAFHASGRRPILPAGPQIINGTANDPAPIPQPSPTHGSYHWAFERLISAALVPLTVAPFAAGTLNPTTDAILCATILIHSHIGFQYEENHRLQKSFADTARSIIIDYIPLKRLPKTRALFWWGLRAATLTVAVGLYEFETNDVGLTEAVTRIWMA